MRTYLISYDLIGPETSEDYKELIKEIKSFPDFRKPLESLWLVETSMSASQIRDVLKEKMDSNDKLLVVDITGSSWATKKISSNVTDWMKDNL